MELVLKDPDASVHEADDLEVIVLCQDGATAPRACKLLYHVAHNAGPGGRLIYSWWTFGVLASSSLRQLAAREATWANLIVVAARDGSALPETVKDYLNVWLADSEHHSGPKALVALLESDQKLNSASRGVLSELKLLAESGSVDFFANGDLARSDAALLRRGPMPSPGNSPGCAGPERGADCRAGLTPSAVAADLETKQPNGAGKEQNASRERTKADFGSRRNRQGSMVHLGAGRLSAGASPGALA